jgi:hypothetical protein
MTHKEEQLLLGADDDSSTVLKLEPFVVGVVGSFVFIVFVKIELNIPFYLSSIWVWNRITLKNDSVVTASGIVKSLHEIQVKRLS